MIDEIKRKCAPESETVKRARRKLKEVLKKQDEQITPEALEATVAKIHKWIADHNDKRILIKGKPIQLFTGNKFVAKTSKKVEEQALMLKNTWFLAPNTPSISQNLYSETPSK
ncbi:MAG TPA: hypothetical protein DCE71_00520 [Parachlamydiales bacterium]|nr:hypothetical protein [Parachlamydiales bacterium]